MERGICPIAVFYFALKHALSLTFKNVIGRQRYQFYQILGHMTIRLAVGDQKSDKIDTFVDQ